MRTSSSRRRARWAALAAVVSLGTGGALTAATVAATSAAAAEGCDVEYRITNSWGGGFQADVTVTNLGDAVSGWELTWQFTGGEGITQAWNADVTQSGSGVSASDVGWNGGLGTGGSASFGFIGSGTAGTPSSFAMNGTTCTGDVGGEPTDDPSDDPTDDPTVDPTDDPTDDPTQPAGEFYVDTGNQAYDAWQAASGTDKALLEKIALTPQSYWVGNWVDPEHARQEVVDYTSRAVAAGKIPVLTVYAIPGRDCGSHSGGGVEESEYAQWVDTVASGIQGEPWVILEPDALAQLGDCDGQGDRIGFLRYAANSLTDAGARVYIDAGHSAWLSAGEAASRLQQVGFADAVGFALNTSNYRTTAEAKAYGEQVSAQIGGRPYVIDTSRNGNGPGDTWCNPRGRALGERPTVVDDGTNLDALLWVKLPGESDGTCNGGPSAGAWWQEMALELARNASW
ncbi:glycoside hydrolase family 6 protein [Myceligenerans pegani]|uniref:Glucanase n=1 Tax=Myceligenerans pegani TaxID=2776917 RepID=A0ABR9N048_9MICO|nr:glycoside hydrolase family 6 protein [Myceligenerans sp. TRM 65318]MBE1877009.1 glycoside hydrolase family 6 protein [Myceligenerans sp. TRM 65318]MBE3019280.1 glycoside hydrolase family 6 protein [Myceligenerans sp. TRM 65318]